MRSIPDINSYRGTVRSSLNSTYSLPVRVWAFTNWACGPDRSHGQVVGGPRHAGAGAARPRGTSKRGKAMISKGIKALCAEAEREIETLSVDEVLAVRDDPNVQLVDVRDIRELWRDGTIPGATHAPPRHAGVPGSTRTAPTTAKNSDPARSSSSTARVACVRHWLHNRCIAWASHRWRTWPAVMAPGPRPTDRLRERKRNCPNRGPTRRVEPGSHRPITRRGRLDGARTGGGSRAYPGQFDWPLSP